jgi:adenine-specific DNA methylase
VTTKTAFTIRGRNPDVLTCIANLSNDEVFTPPSFANRMLDELEEVWAVDHDGDNIWANPDVKFLDPCMKSGVFLREATSRLTTGLATKIPNLEARVDHILTKQIYGIAITHLTSLLGRRSVYCSKFANGPHSVGMSFANEDGNIWFERLEHSWEGATEFIYRKNEQGNRVRKFTNGKCSYCGASQKNLDRGEGFETHAYALIHNNDIKAYIENIFGGNMQFDVIIGNPPYQLDDSGFGTSALPIYNKFVEQAKALDPRYLSMVIPARWFSGGKGLDDFRDGMLRDDHLRVIEDFPNSNDVFPGTQIKGGVLYFLWNKDNPGAVRVRAHDKGEAAQSVERPLLEEGADIFIRFNEAVPILKRIITQEMKSEHQTLSLSRDKQFAALVSARKPFGFDTTFKGKDRAGKNDLTLYRNGGVSYVARRDVASGLDAIDRWKVFIPYAGSGSDAFPHPILGRPFVGPPGSVSSETYMFIGPFKNEVEAKNAISYISTRIFRFLVLLHKPSQHATSKVYTFVPALKLSETWSDEKLRKRWGITDKEWSFIEKMIRPMDSSGEND